MPGALDKITVLDLTHVLAGPFCTYQLALLGANVIKIEPPHDPDCARGRGPDEVANAKGLGLNYQVQGGNKRSLALDLSQPAGRDVLAKLVRTADVLVENFTTGALRRLGLEYQTLRAVNPTLVYCSITGFGDTGLKGRHGAYDNTVQALSGVIGQCGGQKPGVSFVDYATGYAAAFAVSAALLQAPRGAQISVSMLEVAMQMMAPEVAAAQYPTPVHRDKETGISSYDTSDGTIQLGAFRPAQYRLLGRTLAEQGHTLGELFAIQSWPDVWAIGAPTKDHLRKIFASQTTDYWTTTLQAADLPVEPVLTLAQSVALPQLEARGFFQPNPAEPDTLLPTTAFHMSGKGAKITAPPPALGAQTREILAETGLAPDEIKQLYDTGIVA